MRDYVIFTDSCADLDQDMVQALGIEVLPLQFNLDGNEYANYPDGRELSPADFYKILREGKMSSTSQINTAAFVEAWRPFLQRGTDILYLGFSSGLSGTVNSATLAAEELRQEFPDAQVTVVDTLCASLGQGLLVWHAVQQKKQGKSMEEVARYTEDNKLKLVHWFTVDDLNFLKRGGRLSAGAAMLGTMLNIKPVLHVDNEGHLVAVQKVRGRKNSLNGLVEAMERSAIKPAEQMVFISHGDCIDDARYVEEEVKRRMGVQQVYINYIGPVIGSHSGPGTVALFFLGIER